MVKIAFLCAAVNDPLQLDFAVSFFSQMSMNVPAVYTTATSQLHVRTQQDPTLARVTLLTQGMEKAALGTQVTV